MNMKSPPAATLQLYLHPLSSYCHKVLIALYENGTPFEPRNVGFGNPEQHAVLQKLWPIGKFPVLHDTARNQIIPESTIIIEYLAQHYPGRTRLIPVDPDEARDIRARDRFFDLHLHDAVQKIVGDRLRPEGSKDPLGVEQAKQRMLLAYEMIDRDMATRTWAGGEEFTLADCAAAPALFYGNKVVPFTAAHKNVAAYLQRLQQRPSYARARSRRRSRTSRCFPARETSIYPVFLLRPANNSSPAPNRPSVAGSGTEVG